VRRGGSGFGTGGGVGGSICLRPDVRRGVGAGNGVRGVALTARGRANVVVFFTPFPFVRVCLALTLVVLVVASLFLLSLVLLAFSLMALRGLAFFTAAFFSFATGLVVRVFSFVAGLLVLFLAATLTFETGLVLVDSRFLVDLALVSLAGRPLVKVPLEGFLIALASLAFAFGLSLAFFLRAAIIRSSHQLNRIVLL